MSTEFTKEQASLLCGGELPKAGGFDWSRVEYFKLEDGILQPYSGSAILPGPGIIIKTEINSPMSREENARHVVEKIRAAELALKQFTKLLASEGMMDDVRIVSDFWKKQQTLSHDFQEQLQETDLLPRGETIE